MISIHWYPGAINVMYRAENGSVNALNEGVSFATAGMDFSSEEFSVTLENDQQSAVITIPINDVCTSLDPRDCIVS